MASSSSTVDMVVAQAESSGWKWVWEGGGGGGGEGGAGTGTGAGWLVGWLGDGHWLLSPIFEDRHQLKAVMRGRVPRLCGCAEWVRCAVARG